MSPRIMFSLAKMVVIGAVAIGCMFTSATNAVAAEKDSSPTRQSNSGPQLVKLSQPAALAAAAGTQIHNGNADGKCIGISGYIAGDWLCTTNPDQTWHFDTNQCITAYYCHLVNGEGKCLAVAGGVNADATEIWGFNCGNSNNPDQYWGQTAGSPFNLVNYMAGHRVLGVWGGSTDNGARLVLFHYDGTSNQYWYV